MRTARAAVWAAAMSVCAAAGWAQAPAAQAAPATAYALVQPGVDAVRGALAGVKLEKWKRGSVRDEAGGDIGSINTDIQVNLPPLVQAADAAAGAASPQIALVRHVDAVYDVLLRVVEAARIAAPDDQVGALQAALARLGKARLALYDAASNAAVAQEKQVVELHATVERQAAQVAPVREAPAPCVPVRKKTRPKAKTPAKPAAGTAATSPTATSPAAKPKTP